MESGPLLIDHRRCNTYTEKKEKILKCMHALNKKKGGEESEFHKPKGTIIQLNCIYKPTPSPNAIDQLWI